MNLRKMNVLSGLSLLLNSCAGIQRGCSSFTAKNFASDWIVVQYDFDGKPFNCWKLIETSITNERNSDGIYWLDSTSRNLVHLSGWYNLVQVQSNQWERAAESIGVDLDKCKHGKYLPEE